MKSRRLRERPRLLRDHQLMTEHGSPTIYRINVRGDVGPRFTRVFDTFTVERAEGTSTLLGPVRDQAELKGILDLLCALNLTILSVRAECLHAPRRSGRATAVEGR